METRANYVAVGAFVLIMLAGVFVSAIWLLRIQFRAEYAYFETHFEGPVTGLGKGAAARLNGIDIGRVEEIEFDPDDPKQVIVILEVRAGLTIHSDAVTSLETQGLTGVSYVEISGGTKGAPALVVKEGQRYPIITSKPSSFQAVINNAPEVKTRSPQLRAISTAGALAISSPKMKRAEKRGATACSNIEHVAAPQTIKIEKIYHSAFGISTSDHRAKTNVASELIIAVNSPNSPANRTGFCSTISNSGAR